MCVPKLPLKGIILEVAVGAAGRTVRKIKIGSLSSENLDLAIRVVKQRDKEVLKLLAKSTKSLRRLF